MIFDNSCTFFFSLFRCDSIQLKWFTFGEQPSRVSKGKSRFMLARIESVCVKWAIRAHCRRAINFQPFCRVSFDAPVHILRVVLIGNRLNFCTIGLVSRPKINQLFAMSAFATYSADAETVHPLPIAGIDPLSVFIENDTFDDFYAEESRALWRFLLSFETDFFRLLSLAPITSSSSASDGFCRLRFRYQPVVLFRFCVFDPLRRVFWHRHVLINFFRKPIATSASAQLNLGANVLFISMKIIENACENCWMQTDVHRTPADAAFSLRAIFTKVVANKFVDLVFFSESYPKRFYFCEHLSNPTYRFPCRFWHWR